MNELKIFNQDVIPVYTTDTGEKVVVGRELHERLGIGQDYTSWFKRMCSYGFTEGNEFSLFLGKTLEQGGRPKNEHILTLDMAKHIAMIQRSEIGKAIRQKLIDLEKEVAAGKIPSPKQPPLGSVNMMAKIIKEVYGQAGVDPNFTALAVSKVYKEKAGMDLEPPLKTEARFYDQGEIAKELGIYSKTGNPHANAIGAIIEKLEIPETDKVIAPFTNNGHSGTSQKYSQRVVEAIKDWIVSQGYPERIERSNGTACTVKYKYLPEAC